MVSISRPAVFLFLSPPPRFLRFEDVALRRSQGSLCLSFRSTLVASCGPDIPQTCAAQLSSADCSAPSWGTQPVLQRECARTGTNPLVSEQSLSGTPSGHRNFLSEEEHSPGALPLAVRPPCERVTSSERTARSPPSSALHCTPTRGEAISKWRKAWRELPLEGATGR